jgi:anti-anti-sigma factor
VAELNDFEPAELLVEVYRDGPGGPVLRLTGELDLSTVESLDSVLKPLLEPPPERVSFDVAGLQFMDSSGLAVLVHCSTRVSTVTLLHPSTIVRRVIEAAGLATVLAMEP